MNSTIGEQVDEAKEVGSAEVHGIFEASDVTLFEEDYSVYADRGPNCIDWNDPSN